METQGTSWKNRISMPFSLYFKNIWELWNEISLLLKDEFQNYKYQWTITPFTGGCIAVGSIVMIENCL